ncbi:MAG: M1 family metallopeptidase [Pirellulales bacterium]
MNISAKSRLMTFAVIFIFSTFLSFASAEEQHVCRFCADHQGQLFGVDLDGDGRRYAPIRHVDIQHIRLEVTPDFKQQTISVKTWIRFTPLREPAKQLELDAVDLTIDSITGSSKIEEFSSTKKDLTIKFAKPLPVGEEAWVEISHRCQPTGGFYFRTKEMGYDEKDTHCWTQGESHYARQWFPCFDYPNEKSTTEVICHVPEKMTVLSNGKLLSETVDNKTGLKTVHWLQDKPHVNYLICIVAGYLEKLEAQHRDIPLAYYTQPSLIEHAANSFQDTQQIMAFFEKEIGVNYPWHKYYQVTIRDFMAGGMENTSLTTLTHRTIFSKATENIRSSRGLDAHEMAHQWFGDLVTCKDWSHLWLNEGFATFYTHLYEGHKFGNDAKLYGLYRDASGRILSSGNDKKPIVWKDYSNAGEQFDYRAYPKGSWVLHMLRSQLGEDLYRQCIKTYLQKHQLTSVVTEDLNKTLEQVSGRSFDQFFDQWVYHARHPDFKVTYKWLPNEKLARVTVSQTHKVDNDVLLFSVPVTLRFRVGQKYMDHEVLVNAKEHEFFIPLASKPDNVRFDPEYTILANVSFDKPEEMFVAQLADANDMMGRIRKPA